MQCKARCKSTGEQCRRRAVAGKTVCTVHGAGSPKRVREGKRKPPGRPPINGKYSKYFKEEVLNKIEDFKYDPDLQNLDFELGYLKSLLPRIEQVPSDEMSESDRLVVLEKILTSIFKNMEVREKVIEARRYSIGIEKVKLLVQYMFESVRKHVKDPQVLAAIGYELRQLAQKTDNSDEFQQMLEG